MNVCECRYMSTVYENMCVGISVCVFPVPLSSRRVFFQLYIYMKRDNAVARRYYTKKASICCDARKRLHVLIRGFA